MDFFLALFFTVNLLLWVAQAYLDFTLKHIHPFLSYLSVLTVPLVLMDVPLTSFTPLLLVPILDYTRHMAKGDTKLMLQYILSTLPIVKTSLPTLFLTTGAYILIQETILQNKNYPMAPAPATSFLISYLLPLVL